MGGSIERGPICYANLHLHDVKRCRLLYSAVSLKIAPYRIESSKGFNHVVVPNDDTKNMGYVRPYVPYVFTVQDCSVLY